MASLNKLLFLLTGLDRTFKKIIILLHDLFFLSFLFFSLIIIFNKPFITNTNIALSYLTIIITYLLISNFFGVYNWIIRQINIQFNKSIILSIFLCVIISSVINNFLLESSPGYLFFIVYLITALFFIIFSRTIIHELFKNITTIRKYKKNFIIIFDDYSKLSNIDLKNNFFYENILKAYINLNTEENYNNINGVDIYKFNEKVLKKIIKKFNISNVLIFSNNDSKRKLVTSKLFKYNLGFFYIDNDTFLKFSIDKNESPINFSYILERDIIINHNLISKKIFNHKILVTGGGGSIGSELVFQLLKLKPVSIIVYDISEYNLYKISKKIENINTQTKVFYILGSVVDNLLLEQIFKKYQISIVFHVAAYKHVNITQNNIIQVFKNNYLGTKTVSDLSEKYSIENFINISTDKAVNSTNYMGYSKRFAEMYLQLKNYKKSSSIKFSIIRFGNVVGSSGSAISLFLSQIANNENITITDKNVSRYFMTINEAVSLVLETLTFKKSNLFYVLNMGQPLIILDMVKKLINICGYQYSENSEIDKIQFKFTGLKDGEKISEQLFYNKNYRGSENNDIFNVDEKFDNKMYEQLLNKIDNAILTNNEYDIIELIKNNKI